MGVEGMIESPTRRGVRVDGAGSGYYHAPRGSRLHQGLDFICEPGQRIYSPLHNAEFLRYADPYGDGEYGGLLIRNGDMEVLLFYLSVDPEITHQKLYHSTVIGTAQDISLRYPDSPDMIPHVHLQIDSVDPLLFIGKGL